MSIAAVKYWCGDFFVRRILAPEFLREHGYQPLLTPKGGSPRISIEKLRRSYPQLSDLITGSVSVDFDLVGYNPETRILVVGEIKTRLFIRVKYGHHGIREPLKLMLQYHLDWLDRALDAWRRAERMRILEKSLLDNIASVGELAKEILGAPIHSTAQQAISRYYNYCEEMYAALLAPPYLDVEDINVAASILENLVENAKKYVKKLVGYTIIQVKPKKMSQELLPEELEVYCVAGYCAPKPWKKPVTILKFDVQKLKSRGILGCKGCKYISLCRRYGVIP